MKLKYLFFLFFTVACKEKYMPHVDVPSLGYLVVEGFVNSSGPTLITLSHAANLAMPEHLPESGAHVEVQSETGGIFPLTEAESGKYTSGELPIVVGQSYRLYIRTGNGKEYRSDYVPALFTPPIDSVTWTANTDAVSIFVTTHNPSDTTGYYGWQFEETWRYSAIYGSSLEYKNGKVVNRPDTDQIHVCYRSLASSVINVASSEKLSADVIYQYLLTHVPYSSADKLIDRYSILVNQRSLTKEEYEWNLKLKKNTEEIGSIFDAQPTETSGNLHCLTNPFENVIGYIGCTSETEKRIFIDRKELPPVVVFSGYEFCEKYEIGTDSIAVVHAFATGFYIPLHEKYANGMLIGYEIAQPECVDCRLKGGTTVKPPFWQ